MKINAQFIKTGQVKFGKTLQQSESEFSFRQNITEDTFESEQKQNQTLTRFIRKHRLNPKDADEILKNNPEITRYLGSIPNQWFKNTEEKHRADITESIKELLSEFAKQTYVPYETYDDFEQEYTTLAFELTKLLNVPVKAEYIDQGDWGKVFIITVNDKKYALKTFHSTKFLQHEKPGHGMQYETLDTAFISRNIPERSQRYARYYMSKYARKEDKDGFILSDFIEDSSAGAKSHKFRKFFEPVYSLDTLFKNNINGTIYDVGGLRYTYPKYNKEEQRIMRIICDFIRLGNIKALQEFIAKEGNSIPFKNAMPKFKKYLDFFYKQQGEITCNPDTKNQLTKKQFEVIKFLDKYEATSMQVE